MADLAPNTPPSGAGVGFLQDIANIKLPEPTKLPDALGPQASVDALKDVVAARHTQIEDSVAAMEQNTAISQNLQRTNQEFDTSTIEAWEKISKASRFPPGVTKLLGLFDRDWNVEYQQNTIQGNALRAKQAATQAQSLIDINNAKPAMDKLRADITEQDYNFQKSLTEIGLKAREMDQKDLELLHGRINIMMALPEAQRKELDFALNSMTTPEVQKNYKDALAGKGPWAQYPGLLEERLRKEQQADLALEQLDLAVKNGRIDLADKSALRVAHNLPTSILMPLVQKAQAEGSVAVAVGGRQIPIHLALQALKDNNDAENLTTQTIMQNSNMMVNEKLQTVSSSITALAAMGDPEAGRYATMIASAAKNVNPADYNSVQQFHALLTTVETKSKEISKRAAASMPTPESKAAMEQFGTTGKFTPEGSAAVVSAYAGNAGVQATSKYRDAWKVVNTKVAGEIAKQNVAGMPAFDGSATGTQAILAWAVSSGKVKKLDDIRAEAIADPLVHKKAADEIGGTIARGAMEQVMFAHSKDPNASAVWKEVLTSPKFKAPDGSYKLDTIAERLEQETVLSKGKADYNQVLIDDLRKLGIEGDKGLDPGKAPEAKAMEMFYLGDDPYRAALSDFVQRIIPNAAAAHQQMAPRVEADRSGQTQNDAAFMANQAISGGAGEVPGIPRKGPDKDTIEALRRARETAPSATGANSTADRIRALYE